MGSTRVIVKEMMKPRNKILICAAVVLIGWSGYGTTAGIGAENKRGVAKGEASQHLGQQGLGIDAGGASPILAGPEVIVGSITKIQGEEYTIKGDEGQNIRIRITTDTNKVCPSSDQAKISSGKEGVRERGEIPPTAHMQQQSREKNGHSQRAEKSDRKDLQQHATAPPSQPPSRDPSEMKATVGSTDPRANEDVARGSGYQVGRCAFKEGDHVRVEASDMGTATSIKQLLSSRSGE